jgi:outer membrane protein assembly factor BamB
MIFSSKSRVIYGVSYQRDLEIIDLETGVTTQSLRPDGRLVIRCSLNRAGDRLAVATMDPDGGNQRIIMLDTTTLAEMNRFDIQGAVYSMDFVDAAGETLAISLKNESDAHVAFYQSRTGVRTAAGRVWRGNFAASYLLASGDDQTVLCNDITGAAIRISAADGSVVLTYRAAAAGLTSISVVAESKLLLCSGHEAALLDLATGKLLARYQTPDAATSAGLTTDGRRVVVGTLRHQLIAFDVATAQPVWVLDTPLDPRFPSNPVFQADSRMVLITSMDGSIHAGQLPGD